MKHILIGDGGGRSLPFNTVVELVNMCEADPPIHFYSKSPPGIRFVRNRDPVTKSTFPFALAHYVVDPTAHTQHEALHLPIDTPLLVQGADQYHYVMVGAVTPNTRTPGQEQLRDLRYLARNEVGDVVDLRTSERLDENDRSIYVTVMFAFVRLEHFPIYYMVLNSDLVHSTDLCDLYDTTTDCRWRSITPFDVSLRDTLFAPAVSSTARMMGQVILSNGTPFTLSLFPNPSHILHSTPTLLADSSYTIDTNLQYTMSGNDFIIQAPSQSPSYFEIKFNCGRYFDIQSTHERLTFGYVIL